MRQVGILAAGAVFALDHNIERLKEDHDKAKCLATELSHNADVHIDLESVQTNIIIFSIKGGAERAEQFISQLKVNGILISDMGNATLRAVTHLDVTLEQIKKAAALIKSLLVQ